MLNVLNWYTHSSPGYCHGRFGILFAYFYVLAVVKIYVVGQVVNSNPLRLFGTVGDTIAIIIGVVLFAVGFPSAYSYSF